MQLEHVEADSVTEPPPPRGGGGGAGAGGGSYQPAPSPSRPPQLPPAPRPVGGSSSSRTLSRGELAALAQRKGLSLDDMLADAAARGIQIPE